MLMLFQSSVASVYFCWNSYVIRVCLVVIWILFFKLYY